ncbi:TauD/TfdA family dioxygenase [Rhodoblastus acidophilus]|uniref:TauD/TfdA family dioxygenase n=1 Tax=Candidatus Rhodoblastus alkanivorans TaxID=2954117 RepID=A0ABS9Z8P0_9HYPH|nr:TauD/TfdA family dioxygenase [Candidatus Rhodoblastus alkanivorans]MCI4680707.1 TauD/TfdA family dioxygenase [Candidatus Rhodoblastus alkanivorans]MCI4684023.1 TauD/TfdA family dioxygenase [Candidatus Rhodoblastus alkanivorans]MDI4641342.1 TauD/TfdA family dioxygenase [Rhodoblastus acidophilus]
MSAIAYKEEPPTGDRWSPAVFSLEDSDSWRRWRQFKLGRVEAALGCAPTTIENPRAVSQAERKSLLAQVAATNFALYQWRAAAPDENALDEWLLAFTNSFGLRAREDHRSANGNGVVRIEVAREGGRAGYIPYTDLRIAWHTDGYYNYHGPANCVRGMILHCAAAASEGGENRVLDHELAYLRLRDADEQALRLLIRPDAMTIPEATDESGRFRATNSGPVFFLDNSGALTMRYTARKKFVEWRDEETRAAADLLLSLIDADPLVSRVRLAPGQGLLCNNVLHDRTAFRNDENSWRRLCRIRFHNRIDMN